MALLRSGQSGIDDMKHTKTMSGVPRNRSGRTRAARRHWHREFDRLGGVWCLPYRGDEFTGGKWNRAGDAILRLPEADLLSLSPKLSNSNPLGDQYESHNQRRINLPILRRLWTRYPARQMKFVVCGEEDLWEIHSLLEGLPHVKGEDIYLMPEGVVYPLPPSRQWVEAACRRLGWNYCSRLQIEQGLR